MCLWFFSSKVDHRDTRCFASQVNAMILSVCLSTSLHTPPQKNCTAFIFSPPGMHCILETSPESKRLVTKDAFQIILFSVCKTFVHRPYAEPAAPPCLLPYKPQCTAISAAAGSHSADSGQLSAGQLRSIDCNQGTNFPAEGITCSPADNVNGQ